MPETILQLVGVLSVEIEPSAAVTVTEKVTLPRVVANV